ncbi:unnamed protein product [Amoebophrya sp. A120]|nr:unnamed protein product [Amoebophrya sp. A120]|eukprot:GSA120T00006916001.1
MPLTRQGTAAALQAGPSSPSLAKKSPLSKMNSLKKLASSTKLPSVLLKTLDPRAWIAEENNYTTTTPSRPGPAGGGGMNHASSPTETSQKQKAKKREHNNSSAPRPNRNSNSHNYNNPGSFPPTGAPRASLRKSCRGKGVHIRDSLVVGGEKEQHNNGENKRLSTRRVQSLRKAPFVVTASNTKAANNNNGRGSLVNFRPGSVRLDGLDLLDGSPFDDDPIEGEVVQRSVWEQKVLAIVELPTFDMLIGLLLLVNGFLLGLEYELEIEDRDTFWFQFANVFLVILFTLEFLMRFVEANYTTRNFTKWLWFDLFVLVLAWVTDVILPYVIFAALRDPDGSDGGADNTSSEKSNSNIAEILSMTKALNCVRVVRMFSMIEHLWTVTLTFLFAVQPLLWTVIFTLTVCFIFSMVVVALCTFNYDNFIAQNPDALQCHRTLPAFYTLLQIMTLDGWVESIEEVVAATGSPVLMLFFFTTYLSVSALLLLNMVTAVVFKSAEARTDKEQNSFLIKMVKLKTRFDLLLGKIEHSNLGGGRDSNNTINSAADEWVNNYRDEDEDSDEPINGNYGNNFTTSSGRGGSSSQLVKKANFWDLIASISIVYEALGYLGILDEDDALELVWPILHKLKEEVENEDEEEDEWDSYKVFGVGESKDDRKWGVEKNYFLRLCVVLEKVGEDPTMVALVQSGEDVASKQYFLRLALKLVDPTLPLCDENSFSSASGESSSSTADRRTTTAPNGQTERTSTSPLLIKTTPTPTTPGTPAPNSILASAKKRSAEDRTTRATTSTPNSSCGAPDVRTSTPAALRNGEQYDRDSCITSTKNDKTFCVRSKYAVKVNFELPDEQSGSPKEEVFAQEDHDGDQRLQTEGDGDVGSCRTSNTSRRDGDINPTTTEVEVAVDAAQRDHHELQADELLERSLCSLHLPSEEERRNKRTGGMLNSGAAEQANQITVAGIKSANVAGGEEPTHDMPTTPTTLLQELQDDHDEDLLLKLAQNNNDLATTTADQTQQMQTKTSSSSSSSPSGASSTKNSPSVTLQQPPRPPE